MQGVEFLESENLHVDCGKADVISCATGSHSPLIKGDWIKPGAHCDLVGNHLKDGRECDTALITGADVYVDSRDNTFNEAGELLIPVAEGVFSLDQVRGELCQLCSKEVSRQEDSSVTTVFKAVGTALSDLVASSLISKKLPA